MRAIRCRRQKCLKPLLICLIFLPVLVYLAEVLFYNYEISQTQSLYAEPSEIKLASKKIVLISACRCRVHEQIHIKPNGRLINVFLLNTATGSSRLILSLNETAFYRLRVTCNLYKTLRRGLNQRILAYSLYGSESRYYVKLASIQKQASHLYSGWSMRIYHDSSINESIICQMECEPGLDNVDFCDANSVHLSFANFISNRPAFNAKYMHSRTWRWLPLGDDMVDILASRDSDTYIIDREIHSVNAWLESTDKTGHIMRDHPLHGNPILAGMWGFKMYRNRPLAGRLFFYLLNRRIAAYYVIDGVTADKSADGLVGHTNGPDEMFLRDYFYPLIKFDSVVHDSFHCGQFRESVAWPIQRVGNCFVGSSDHCNETANDSNDCPDTCKPKKHLDWKKC